MILSLSTFNSCEFDTSPEYDHPLYVTYTISAGSVDFVGPDELLLDIQEWIKENQVIYDKQVSYKTGAASEFSKADAEAGTKFDEFLPIFRSYLDEVKKKLQAGTYKANSVSAIFYVYASRSQGEQGDIKYDQIKFAYP